MNNMGEDALPDLGNHHQQIFGRVPVQFGSNNSGTITIQTTLAANLPNPNLEKKYRK